VITVSDAQKQETAYALRITEPGIPGANPEVFAEFHGAIFYLITEEFTPGRMDYPYPDMDMYEYTMPRLKALNISVEMLGARQVTGTLKSFHSVTDSFVGVELWKPLGAAEPCTGESVMWRLRYHRCTVRLIEPGCFEVRSVLVPKTTMLYTGQVLPQGEDTPKMRGTNDE
jgi:hypothetical protein